MGGVAAQCRPACHDLVHGDGIAEVVDDPLALEGDVRDSEAMINHQLLKAARDGDVPGIYRAIQRGAYLETRRPFCLSSDVVSAYANAGQNRGTGLTPLMHASLNSYPEAVNVLLASKASVIAEDEDGVTALHFAASSGSIEICKALLMAGAKASRADDEGKTPYDYIPEWAVTNPVDRKTWMSALGSPPDAPQSAPDEDSRNQRQQPVTVVGGMSSMESPTHAALKAALSGQRQDDSLIDTSSPQKAKAEVLSTEKSDMINLQSTATAPEQEPAPVVAVAPRGSQEPAPAVVEAPRNLQEPAPVAVAAPVSDLMDLQETAVSAPADAIKTAPEQVGAAVAAGPAVGNAPPAAPEPVLASHADIPTAVPFPADDGLNSKDPLA